MRGDDEEPIGPVDPLPASVRRAHAASRRPRAAHWFVAACAFGGGLTAILVTVAFTFGQATAAFCLFTVPLGVALGTMTGGRQVDRAVRAYRPTM